MKIQLTANRSKANSAWTKAPSDVAVIAERLGFEMYDIDAGRIGRSCFAGRVLNKLGLLSFANRLVARRHIAALTRRFKDSGGGELLIQHPAPIAISEDCSRIDDLMRMKMHGVRITVLVHDIGWFHSENPNVTGDPRVDFERKLFLAADKLVVHNQHMQEYLHNHGIPDERMVSLEIFDYLIDERSSNDSDVTSHELLTRPQVMIAGGMGGWKASYLESVCNIKEVDWNLCGVEYDPNRIKGENVKYIGCFPPDEVPFRLKGDFGLVWHGNTIETCAGRTGEYLKINNPHKLSLYLASGLPVIIWAQAAEADFVRKHKLGITVESLRDIPSAIESLSKEQYRKIADAVRAVGEKLRRGVFTREALNA